MTHPLQAHTEAYIKSFWGFSPETWGCVSFYAKGRRDTLLRETTDPFLMAIFATDQPETLPRERGKLLGFYEISHEIGDRSEFITSEQNNLEKGRWPFAMRAVRAWRIPGPYQPDIHTFDPSLKAKSRSVGRDGARVSPDVFKKMMRLPLEPVDVFGHAPLQNTTVFFPRDPLHPKLTDISDQGAGWVRGGAFDLSGHFAEPQNPAKQLYILELTGELCSVFPKLGGKRVIKVGLSHEPEKRLRAFNHALPKCLLNWSLLHSTSADGDGYYPSPFIAEVGELAMKKYLGSQLENHLGGEFYKATTENIRMAWDYGRKVAMEAMLDGDFL